MATQPHLAHHSGMKRLCSAAAIVLCLLPVNASAGGFEYDPEIKDGRVRGSLVIGHSVSSVGSVDLKSIVAAPRLTIDYRVLSELVVWVDVPTSHLSSGYDTDQGLSTFELANIEFGASYVSRLSNTLVLHVGGGLSVPSATSSNIVSGAAHSATALSHSLWDFWQYIPDRLTVVSDNELVFRTGSFRAVAHLDLGFLIPTKGDVADNLMLLGQVQFDAAFRSKVIETGLSLRGTFMLYAANDLLVNFDRFQGSVAPFFKAFISGGFLDVRFNINLDSPGGFSFDDGKWWGLEIGLGVFL